MKYIKQLKKHLVPDDLEWSLRYNSKKRIVEKTKQEKKPKSEINQLLVNELNM